MRNLGQVAYFDLKLSGGPSRREQRPLYMGFEQCSFGSPQAYGTIQERNINLGCH